ncbi:hypothetical protein ACLI4Z_19245 (plasmid) [Natrialbaceae archaeon A-arb3/5]
MGGLGSGRYGYADTPTVGACHTLEVNALTNLTEHPGAAAPYRWRDEYGHGDDVASILVRSLENGTPTLAGGTDPDREDVVDALEGRATHFALEYTVTPPNGEPRDYKERIPLEYTAVHFGGVRPWFRCPGCRDRVGKLHRPPGEDVFRCRECFDLGYQSSRTSGDAIKQAELRYRRAFAKADAKDRRPHPNGEPWYPERPKGMHRETFDALLADLEQARDKWDQAFHSRLRELTGRLVD